MEPISQEVGPIGRRVFNLDPNCFNTTLAGDSYFLDLAIDNIKNKMTSHVSHFGVHDHGFNNLSTYGNLLRLMNEGKIA